MALLRTAGVSLITLALAGCGAAERIADIGRAPDLDPIENPVLARPQYTQVSMPMPAPQVAETRPNSLWQSGATGFFRDQRAAQIGDILTVIIKVDDQATLSNQTSRGRNNSESAGLPNLFGLEGVLADVLPDGADPASLVDLGSSSNSTGTGQIRRREDIEMKIAAVVSDQLPNGNLVIYGRQQIRVNFEARDLEIAGIIRPQDITSANTIPFEKIAEARVSYGGRGQMTDVQQPRYGQQLYDIIMPF